VTAATTQQRQTATAQTEATIHAQLEAIWIPGGLRELRILGTSQGTVAGFFDDPQALAEAAAPFNGRAQLYMTANLVDPALPRQLKHAINRLVVKPKGLTGNADILRRVMAFIDVDPVRGPHLSATDAEHRAALDRVEAICAWLIARECPADALLTIDSGNGAYALPRIDLPNTPEAAQLVARFTRAIAEHFTDAVVKVDGSVTNAARIMKLPGTLAMKGPNTSDRPHRRAGILFVPAVHAPIPESPLREIASLVPDDPEPPALATGRDRALHRPGLRPRRLARGPRHAAPSHVAVAGVAHPDRSRAEAYLSRVPVWFESCRQQCSLSGAIARRRDRLCLPA
jgi:hypothetical protein